VERMEPEVTICRGRKKGKADCNIAVLFILSILFAFTLGLLIGAAISGTILENLAAIIVLAILLGILILVQLIRLICRKEKSYCDK